jgi:AraC family transcriptional regulator
MPIESISARRAPSLEAASMPLVLLKDMARARASTLNEAREREATSTPDLLRAVSALISALQCALSGERGSARQYLSAASQSLESDTGRRDGVSMDDTHDALERCRGGLAPWQVRRVTAHIDEHLSGCIQCEDLSALANLSLSHFMRAFRDSFGCPPHTYLMKRRMQRAQGLMLTTSTSLGQIALECGFADQSHLSRLFQRFVGESPAAWRRARATAAYSNP